jgi:hypothetical protein
VLLGNLAGIGILIVVKTASLDITRQRTRDSGKGSAAEGGVGVGAALVFERTVNNLGVVTRQSCKVRVLALMLERSLNKEVQHVYSAPEIGRDLYRLARVRQ